LGSFLTTFLATPAQSGRQMEIGLGKSQLPFRRHDGEAEALRYIRHRSKYLHTSIWERTKFAIAQTYGMLVNGLALALLPAAFALVEYVLRPWIDASLSPLNLAGRIALGLIAAALMVPLLVRFMRPARNLADGLLAILAVALVVLLAWGRSQFFIGQLTSIRAEAKPVTMAWLFWPCLVPSRWWHRH
jgi:hypothetical protein